MSFRRCLATAAHHRRHLAAEPTFSIPIPPLVKRNPPHPPTPPPALKPSADDPTSARISELLHNPALQPGPDLEKALSAAEINPTPALLLGIFKKFDSSPKPLFTLFNWARKRPDYGFSIDVFNAMVDSLGKAREFDSAWCVILDQIGGDPSERPNFDTFVIMIRRYARAGLPFAAIRTYEYVCSLDSFHDSNAGKNLLETLLDSLCKERHVRIASNYLDTCIKKDPSWSPSVRTYNVLLHGWLRIGKLKRAERIREQMREAGVEANVVTYGTLVEGLCQMRQPDMALELVDEMRAEGVEPNAIVYNPIIDALGEAGRLKEALGMLERLSVLETGPTLSTYNSLVKGFCKAGDLVGAGKVVKMMMNDKCFPTITTYGYFFKFLSKVGKTEAALDLYNQMIKSGYDLDRFTYHLLVKMLCRDERLDLATQVAKEMRARGVDLDLAASTMLIHLLWKLQRYDEAVFEFVDMFRRGIVPQHLTYQRMTDDLERRGMTKTAHKLHDLMASVPRSTKLPNTYKGSQERRVSIMKRAESMSQILKTCKSPSDLPRTDISRRALW
uniref:Pentatricopeptide repeat protein n=1 Tax=Salvia miltiorrhiza TaxID=226208 RepID=A0A678WDW1_SALMI|nr:pentatricopeptide repeat protein [Salvia miltiorrhiza]